MPRPKEVGEPGLKVVTCGGQHQGTSFSTQKHIGAGRGGATVPATASPGRCRWTHVSATTV